MDQTIEKTIDYSSKEYLNEVDKYWRAANYLSVGQLYLKDNPLLKRPLKATDVKVHPIGHWGTIAGQNFIYAHLNRVINKYNLNMFYIEGPGHGGQVMVSNSYLDGSYTELYPKISQDEQGLQRLFKQFSFPGGVASHADPKTPGSIHEGGELGYSILHGAGAVLDNPDLIAAVVVGDGESETGPLATSWQVNKFLNPITDGTVLPILNLNGFKIANPTVLARESHEELVDYFKGLGWDPHFVEGSDPDKMHPQMAAEMDKIVEEIESIRKNAKDNNDESRPVWPMLVLRAPKGWTGPKTWDGEPIEGSFRAHQIPIPVDQKDMEHADDLVAWLESYKPKELFNDDGTLKADIEAIIPKGSLRMEMNPVTNGGILAKHLEKPNPSDYAVDNKDHGANEAQDMTVLGAYIRDLIKLNDKNRNFRGFGPDETLSNRLNKVFEATNRQWMEPIHKPYDALLASHGRIIDSMLSEHMDEGMLEGYTLTGRYGFFASYESFLRVVDSMLTQHFKWLRNAHEEADWRADVPALNVIASSTAFQQDHNGYSHQDPGVISHLAEKKTKYIRAYLPADANTLVRVFDKSVDAKQVINLIVSSKHPRPQWFTDSEAKSLVEKGLGIIDWASTDQGAEPDLVIAAAGSEPTLESLAAISILHKALPSLRIRFINVVDLLKLKKDDPRGLSDEEFDMYFTKDKPVIFAYHGYDDLIKDIFFDRHNHNVRVHGYREEGDITTPFDMRVRNKLDRFNLVKEAVLDVPEFTEKGAHLIQDMDDELQKHHDFIREEGTDLPEVEEWKWEPLK
ncbi:Xylulose-5-phosphate phosphoketolase, Fructose-6-phosphate phosphoketolase [Lacticaseibacillus paracasei subsp. paracasei Lpp226]|uniref:phosphoketolase family protein n=1 Tax=Lacticaseibacillus paracasei TaxID=1597 RepID=UPI00034332D0|nr:phosphoketolase family protein [Lacticaseibacillus paracasei]EPC16638.1 Xylulose-5-phosphate phosphoketolase, Fructose-6-phosphate phosphoketolase [Lacticaseibacillus paracasei subsp. paracasei Lpp226]